MDFLLKKTISMFAMPLPLGVVLVLLGLLFLYKNQLFKAKFTLAMSIAWLFLFSYPPFVNTLLSSIENSYPTLHHPPKEVQYIYVLGSGHHTDTTQPITSQVSPTALVRLSEGIRLYKLKEGKAKLIVSGYSGLNDPTPHAIMQTKLATALGIPIEDILLYPKPKDTQEEATEAKALLHNKPFILVTSASHMARAMHFFKKEGLSPIPAPTNHLSSTQHPNYADFFSSNALANAHIVFHEVLGRAWVEIKDIVALSHSEKS
jgi:uncharacterized SAM-binding protein YcdF (DUF218 family)